MKCRAQQQAKFAGPSSPPPHLLCTLQLFWPKHSSKTSATLSLAMQVLNVLPEDPELQLNLARQIIHHSLTNKARQSQAFVMTPADDVATLLQPQP